MYRKLLSLSLAVLFTLSLVACSPDPSTDNPVSQGQSSSDATSVSNPAVLSDPNHYVETISDNLKIDARIVPLPDDAEPGVYLGSVPQLNQEIVDNFLATIGDSVAVVNQDEYLDELKMWNYFLDTEKQAFFGSNYSVDSIDVPEYRLSYSSSQWHWYNNVIHYKEPYQRVRNPELDNSHRYQEPKSFAFATEDEALEQVQAILNSLGIYNAEVIETLYLDHAIMAEEEKTPLSLNSMTGKGGEPEYKPQWTEDDDAYYFIFNIAHTGIYLQPSMNSNTDLPYAGSTVDVLYGKDGLVWLVIDNPWVFGELVESSEALMPTEDVISRVKEILQFSATPYTRTVDEIALRYYYRQDGDKILLRPCWVASVLGEDIPNEFMGQVLGEPYDDYSFIIFDAITGQEL